MGTGKVNRSKSVCYRQCVFARDTSLAAAEVQEQSYRQLGVAGRLRIVFELSDMTHAFAIAGIKRRAPCTDGEAKRLLAKALYGASVL